MTQKQELVKKLDGIFSKYVRLRDSNAMGMCVCISCGRAFPYNQCDAGHYRPRTHMATRFHEQNVWAQCVLCNRFKDGNMEEYDRRLRQKIGDEAVDNLIALSHSSRHFSDSDIIEMIDKYSQLNKVLSHSKSI